MVLATYHYYLLLLLLLLLATSSSQLALVATKEEFAWGAYGGGDLAHPQGAADFKHVAWGMAGGVCGQVGGNAASQGCYVNHIEDAHRHSH